VAFVGGLAVAASLLDDQAKALAGVAISASLVTPATNAGVMFVAYYFAPEQNTRNALLIRVADTLGIPPVSYLSSNGGGGFGFGIVAPMNRDEYWNRALISLCSTLSNIVAIYLASVIMFRLKEVRISPPATVPDRFALLPPFSSLLLSY